MVAIFCDCMCNRQLYSINHAGDQTCGGYICPLDDLFFKVL